MEDKDAMIARMNAAMQTALTAAQREVLMRHFIGREPYRIIAEERGCTQAAVCQMQRRALRRLRSACYVPAYNPSGMLD